MSIVPVTSAVDQEVEKDSQFCRQCGPELDFTSLEQEEEGEQLERRWDQLHKEFNEATDRMQIDMERWTSR